MPSRARAAASPESDALARVEAWTRDYAPLPGIPDEFIDANGERRPHWQRLLRALAELGPGGNRPALRGGRPPHPQPRHVLPRPRRNRRAKLAAEPHAAVDPRVGMARHRARGRFSAPSCSIGRSPTSTARVDWSPKGCCRRRRSPARATSSRRCAASPRRADIGSGSTPPTSAAGPTAAGGRSATAARPRRVPVTRWRTGWSSRRPSPTFTAE